MNWWMGQRPACTIRHTDSASSASHKGQALVPLIFIQLNEINFDIVRRYVARFDDLPAFKQLLDSFAAFETFGEQRYEELEPWIQWVSAQTGKSYAEHGVFRLGDVVHMPEDVPQVFELLERSGLKVGAISPMNARNRLKAPAYFVPDPWTDTPADASGFSRRLTQMLRQTVNDNAAGRVSLRSKLTLLEALLRSFRLPQTPRLLRFIWQTRLRPWTKSLVLDQLIHLVHLCLWRRERPDVSYVFLNAGAHVQHHYFLNAIGCATAGIRNPEWYVPGDADPVHDMLRAYDGMLNDYLMLARTSGVRLVVATGLSQEPYDRVKYYYRLGDHASFLKALELDFMRVQPRMTRDFEIEFSDAAQASAAAQVLGDIRLERTGKIVFGDVDVRGHDLFVTLTYPDEILLTDVALTGAGRRLAEFGRAVHFVAIKNGMHSTRGFAFVSPAARLDLPGEAVSVTHLFDLTLQLAGVKAA